MNNFCTQCGTKSDGGNFCTKCGNALQSQVNTISQIQTTSTGCLVLERKGKVMGFAVKIHIKINGIDYELGAGENITLNLVPGLYQISYGVWCRSDEVIAINIVSGNNYLIDFVYDPLWGGFKIGKNSKLQ